MSTTNRFKSDPRRDAWKAIKGFHYQVLLTALRWLTLPEDGLLICECGEDIDHVAAHLQERPNRLLEQVKSTPRITLATPTSIACMVRFHETMTANPEMSIRYRLTTTATPGKERGHSFLGRGGIEAWQMAQRAELSGDNRSTFLTSLKRLLRNSQCPPGISQSSFRRFKSFIEKASLSTLYSKLVEPFEWAVGSASAADTQILLQQTLRQRGQAASEREAQIIVDAIVVHVLSHLALKGEKRFDRRGLDEVIERAGTVSVDRALLTRLEEYAHGTKAELSVVSEQVSLIANSLASADLPKRLDAIERRLGTPGDLELSPRPLPELPPIMPGCLSLRAELMDGYQACLERVNWLALQGAAGMGKTLSALLLSGRYSSPVWIGLSGDLAPDEASWRLEGSLRRVLDQGQRRSEATAPEAYTSLAALVGASLRAGAIVVLDELPELVVLPNLAKRIVVLAAELQKSKVALVTTSRWRLPESVLQAGLSIANESVPAFSKAEMQEILALAGAPPQLRTEKFAAWLLMATEGHPALVASTVRFLEKEGWNTDQDRLVAILSGEPAEETRRETRRKVFALVRHEESRELLCRVSMVGSAFDRNLVDLLALIPPQIQRPGEYFTELLGPWITEMGSRRFSISPLLKDIGRETLNIADQARIHKTLLNFYLGQKRIDRSVATKIALHGAAAKQWKELVGFMVQLAWQMKTKEEAFAVSLLAYLFDGGWPEEMSNELRMLCCGAQVRHLDLLGEDSSTRSSELNRLVNEGAADFSRSAFNALLLAGPLNPAADAVEASRRGLMAWRLRPLLPELAEETTLPFAGLIWAPLLDKHTAAGIKNLLAILSEMTEVERQEMLALPPDELGLSLILDLYLNLTGRKERSADEWADLLADLEEMRRLAQLPGARALRAPVERARAIVHSEGLRVPRKALEDLEVRAGFPDADLALLAFTAGCILMDEDEHSRASLEFGVVLETAPEAFWRSRDGAPGLIVESAMKAGEYRLALQRALKLFRMMVRLRKDKLATELLGEISWIYWQVNERKRSWGAMSGVVTRIVAQQIEDRDEAKETFRKAGHVLGWLAAVASTGSPPLEAGDGEAYLAPYPGIFTRSKPAMASYSDKPMLTSGLSAQIGQFAIGVGLETQGRLWLERARQTSRNEAVPGFMRSFVALELADCAALDERYEDAVELGLEGCRFLAIHKHLPEEALSLETEDQVEQAWKQLPRERREEGEKVLFWPTLGAAIARQLIKPPLNPDRLARTIERLERVFEQKATQLESYNYWRLLLQDVRLLLDGREPDAQRERIRTVALSPGDDSQLPIIAEVLLTSLPGLRVEEICGHHVRAFALLLRFSVFSRAMRRSVSEMIVSSWHLILSTRSFSLTSPRVLRSVLTETDPGDDASVSRLLLAAIDATSLSVSDGLLSTLRSTARKYHRDR